jgi:hypothetical protein
MIMGLLGGLALFLYGMEKMSDDMKKSAGSKMRAILTAVAQNSVIVFFVGAFVTLVRTEISQMTKILGRMLWAVIVPFTTGLTLNSYSGMNYERLRIDGLMWPCPNSDHPGTLFLPIHFGENHTNVLTNTEASDPLAKIPEFKVSAVNIASYLSKSAVSLYKLTG